MNSDISKKVLIIHEDEERLSFLRRELSRYSYTILTERDGKRAYEIAKNEKPELILASSQAIGIDGFDLCWMIRQNEILQFTPYMLLSHTSNPEVRINAYRSGVDAYIEPDASIREIHTLIESFTRRIQQLKGSVEERHVSLRGQISHILVIEILQLLHISQKSGTLTLVNGLKKGSIGYLDGKLVWAETQEKVGEDAVSELVSWREGTFDFQKDQIRPLMNIHTPTMQLILNCAKMIDETGQ